MVSPMASTCDRCTAGCTKTSPKILRPKNSEKKKTHPIQPEKGETGCVLGAGGGGSGWERIKLGAKSQSLNQNEPHSHAPHAKRNPAETQCFRRVCGRGRRTCTLGTRFWSGCGNSAQRAGEGQGCAVLPAKSQNGRCWFGAVRKNEWIERAFCHLSQNDCFYLRFVL